MKIWSRVQDFFGRLFGPRPPAPGHFESGAKFSFRGWLAVAPWIWPRRKYLLYVPAGWSWFRRAPLLVFCHGCKQTPEDFAQGTRVAALADRLGCLVLLPRQKKTANVWRCWNWFDPAVARGYGEVAIVAAMIRSVRWRYRADRRRVLAIGMSAGGALAATLGVRHPEVVRAVAIHSGIACGAAKSAFTAIGVMQRGPETDVAAIGAEARTAASASLPIPLIVMHGMDDPVVGPVNSVALVRQFLCLNGHPVVNATAVPAGELPPADAERSETTAGGRMVTTRDWRIGERLVARHVAITGLGHAWSGGDDELPFNDAGAPDATALIGTFLREALP